MNEKKELSPKEKVEKIVELILTKKKGDTLKFNELNLIINENLKDEYGKIRFRKIMQRSKNKLIEHGILIRGINGIGYYILKTNQMSSYTYRNYMIKPIKQMQKGKKILDNLNKKELNNEETKQYELTKTLNDNLININKDQINSKEFISLKNI